MSRLFSFAAVLLALCASQSFAEVSREGAQEIVREIYAQYGERGEPFAVPETHFTPELLALWREADAAAKGGVEQAIGFQIFTDARDKDVVDAIETQFMAGRYVVVSFMVMVEEERAIVGHKKHFMYTFVETPEGLKIDDIDWGREKPTLRGYLETIRAGKG